MISSEEYMSERIRIADGEKPSEGVSQEQLERSSKSELQKKFESYMIAARDTALTDLDKLVHSEFAGDLFVDERSDEVTAHIVQGLQERGTDVSKEAIAAHLHRLRNNVDFERNYYASAKSELSDIGDIIVDPTLHGDNVEDFFAQIASLRIGGRNEQDRFFLEIIRADGNAVEDVFPAVAFGNAVLLGVPDFAIGRLPSLALDGCEADTLHAPLANGKHLIRLKMHEMEPSEDHIDDRDTLLHELHHVQSLIRGRRSFTDKGFENDGIFEENVMSDVLTVIDELAARTIDAGWNDFATYLNMHFGRYDLVRELQAGKGAWTQKKEDLWLSMRSFSQYLERNVFILERNMFSRRWWTLFRHMIAGSATIQEAEEAIEISFAWFITQGARGHPEEA